MEWKPVLYSRVGVMQRLFFMTTSVYFIVEAVKFRFTFLRCLCICMLLYFILLLSIRSLQLRLNASAFEIFTCTNTFFHYVDMLKLISTAIEIILVFVGVGFVRLYSLGCIRQVGFVRLQFLRVNKVFKLLSLNLFVLRLVFCSSVNKKTLIQRSL